jgi:hypothetical protein
MSNEMKDWLEENEQEEAMSIAECQVETQKHIERVRHYIRFVTDRLTLRGVKHDAIKLESPEIELFAKHTKHLSNTAYNSEGYKMHLAALKPALDHHYANSRHHPEHFPKGINDMNLVDIMEMICDWKASSERQKDGNLLKSIEMNATRFGYDDQVKQIFINTAKLFDEHD